LGRTTPLDAQEDRKEITKVIKISFSVFFMLFPF